MAYDEDLADRIREQIGGDPAVTERKMFGERLQKGAGVAAMEMRGRSMTGWLRVDVEHVRTTRQLQRWVGIGSATARALPPKR